MQCCVFEGVHVYTLKFLPTLANTQSASLRLDRIPYTRPLVYTSFMHLNPNPIPRSFYPRYPHPPNPIPQIHTLTTAVIKTPSPTPTSPIRPATNIHPTGQSPRLPPTRPLRRQPRSLPLPIPLQRLRRLRQPLRPARGKLPRLPRPRQLRTTTATTILCSPRATRLRASSRSTWVRGPTGHVLWRTATGVPTARGLLSEYEGEEQCE